MRHEAPPELNYPVYAICSPEGPAAGMLALNGKSPRDQSNIKAIVVCTHRAIVRAFIADVQPGGHPVEIRSALDFRHFLFHQKPPVFGVAIDPDVNHKRILTRWC